MSDIIDIQDVDDIFLAVANTRVVDEPCSLFIESVDLMPEIATFIEKHSASDTEVVLSNFLINKEYKKYKAGLSVKMWLDWDHIFERQGKAVLYKLMQNRKNELLDMKQMIDRLQHTVLKTELSYIPPDISSKTVETILLTNRETLLIERDALVAKYKSKLKRLFHGREITRRLENINARIENINEYLKLREKNIDSKVSEFNKVIKIIESHSPRTNVKYKALKYEKCMYSFITSNIVKTHVSPNFIPLIASKSCLLREILPSLKFDSGANKTTHTKHTKHIGISAEKYELFNELATVVPDIKLSFIITGTGLDRTKFKSLSKMIYTFEADSSHAFDAVFFQAVYSLAVMEYFGIVHNDLHFNNILIQEYNDPVCMNFVLPGSKTIQIRTRYVLKFFDWDRGYLSGLGDNPMLEDYRSLSVRQINSTRPKQDFYQFMCVLSEFPNIWSRITQFFDTIPKKSNFYVFTSGVRRDFQSVYTNDKSEVASIISAVQKVKTYTPSDREGDIIYWAEISADEVSKMPTIKDYFKTMYPNKPLEMFENVYLGFRFMDERTIPVDISKVSKIFVIEVIFSPGFGCQSLFDVKSSILKSAREYIQEPRFLSYFSGKCSDKTTKTYTFPSSDVKPKSCVYSW